MEETPKPHYYFDYLLTSQRFPQSIYHTAKISITNELVSRLKPGSQILDAGCGSGYVSAPYINSHVVTGVDEQDASISYCREHLKGLYLKVDLCTKTELQADLFDLILFHDSIEHFEEPLKPLAELQRVLKPGGTIVVSTINYSNPLWFILENTWHRAVAGNCRTYAADVHPTRYDSKLLRKHCRQFFKEMDFRIKMLWMELFFIGSK